MAMSVLGNEMRRKKCGQEVLFRVYVLVCVPTEKLTNPLSENQMPSSTVLIGHYFHAVSTLVW